MEFKHTLEILYNQAEEISKIAAKLQSEGELRQIEIDLLMEKLRDIYDLANDLQSTIKPEAPPPVTQTQGVTEKTPEIPREEAQDPVFEIESTIEPEPEAPKKPREPEKKPESSMVSDRFKSSARILNEEMSDKKQSGDISSQYKSSPISSITSAIGVNERFELINELFQGDKPKFDKTMEVLNMAGSFVEAYNYLEEQFEWDMNNPYVQRILELIRRKLIVRRNES